MSPKNGIVGLYEDLAHLWRKFPIAVTIAVAASLIAIALFVLAAYYLLGPALDSPQALTSSPGSDAHPASHR